MKKSAKMVGVILGLGVIAASCGKARIDPSKIGTNLPKGVIVPTGTSGAANLAPMVFSQTTVNFEDCDQQTGETKQRTGMLTLAPQPDGSQYFSLQLENGAFVDGWTEAAQK